MEYKRTKRCVKRMKMPAVLIMLIMLLTPPAFAGSKDQGKWATIYNWCANEAPEYLFDARFDEWMDDCISDNGKRKRKR